MRLYYFTSATYGLQNIEKRRLKIARINDLNDPFEFLPLRLSDKAARKGMREMKKLAHAEFGIVCFTDDWVHPMMWSHYADRHRGLCLGFDVIHSRPIIPIEYTSALFEAKDFRLDQFDSMTTVDYMRTWFIKYDAWDYERERRMVFQLADEEMEDSLYFHRFEPGLRLAEVVVGAESKITREQLGEAIGDLPDVEMVKARLAFQKFAVVKQHEETMWRNTEDLDPDQHAL